MVTGPDHPQEGEIQARPSPGYYGNSGSPPSSAPGNQIHKGRGWFRIVPQDGVCLGKWLSW